MSFLRPWRVLTWKHWAWATVIPIAISITAPVQSFHTNWYWAPQWILFRTPLYLLFSYAVLLAIAVVESAAPARADPPVRRYVIALGVVTLLFMATLGAFPDLVRSAPKQVTAGETVIRKPTGKPANWERARRVEAAFSSPGVLIHGWIVVFVYVWLRKSHLAARKVADAELERTEAQRNLLAAQLMAADAQVDPAFVLRALDEVESAYENDPARGDLLLDEFIAYLRDAIPRVRAVGPATTEAT